NRRPCIDQKEQRLRWQRYRGHQSGNYRGPRQLDSGCWYREGEDSLGADLRVQTRSLRDVLRPQSGFWTPGRTWRGHGSYRGAVHRRAWNAAHDAYLPHRWYGIASLGTVATGSQEQRLGPLHQSPDGEIEVWRSGGDEPRRIDCDRRRPWTRKRALLSCVRREAARWRR